jgi:hypothetical protein
LLAERLVMSRKALTWNHDVWGFRIYPAIRSNMLAIVDSDILGNAFRCLIQIGLAESSQKLAKRMHEKVRLNHVALPEQLRCHAPSSTRSKSTSKVVSGRHSVPSPWRYSSEIRK